MEQDGNNTTRPDKAMSSHVCFNTIPEHLFFKEKIHENQIQQTIWHNMLC